MTSGIGHVRQILSPKLLKIVRSGWLLVFTMVCFSTGCDPAPHHLITETQLTEKNRQLEALASKNDELEIKISQLQDTVIELQAELDNLKVKEADLRAWSQQLAESYGPAIWFFSSDERPLPRKTIANATAATLIRELNQLLVQSGMPTVSLIKIEKDTAYVRINDEKKLTQGMGTTGATGYIEAVTYTLTSLKNIHYVDFDFKEGDHAIPGRYSR